MALFESLAVLAAKFASASTVAQATAGLGIAVAGVTGAGAAGVLPGPVQDGVAGAIETVTSFDLPDSADDHAVHAVETDDPGVDGPGDLPASSTVAPPSTPVPETAHSPEPGDDDGVHQHRGGVTSAPAVRTSDSGPGSANTGRDHAEDDAPASSSASTEVEEHEDGSHHGGDDSGGSDDDSSGHLDGDDD